MADGAGAAEYVGAIQSALLLPLRRWIRAALELADAPPEKLPRGVGTAGLTVLLCPVGFGCDLTRALARGTGFAVTERDDSERDRYSADHKDLSGHFDLLYGGHISLRVVYQY